MLELITKAKEIRTVLKLPQKVVVETFKGLALSISQVLHVPLI